MLFDLRNKAKKPNDEPYIFRQYNMSGVYYSKNGIFNLVKRLLYAFAEALNDKMTLPKLIVIIPDIDLLTSQQNKPGISIIIGSLLHFVIKQMDMYIHRRRIDLVEKRP